jgi:hypothetical protein
MFPTTMLFFYFVAIMTLLVVAPSLGVGGIVEPVRSLSTAQKVSGVTDVSARRRYRGGYSRGGGGGFGYGSHDNSGPRSSG